MLTLLTVGIVAFAAVTIWGKYNGPPILVYFFKPATMALVMAVALTRAGGHLSFYTAAVLCGMSFSLLGDVFLMLPSDRFVPGLASFLVAHLFYISAFLSEARTPVSPLLIPYLLYAALMMWALLPHTGRMWPAVLAYMTAILVMGWRAGEMWLALGARWSAFAALGGALFILSDSILAWDRFRKRFRSAQFLLLVTYFSAQWALAMSVHP